MNYVDCIYSFFCIDSLMILLIIELFNLKKPYSRISEKHEESTINLTKYLMLCLIF